MSSKLIFNALEAGIEPRFLVGEGLPARITSPFRPRFELPTYEDSGENQLLLEYLCGEFDLGTPREIYEQARESSRTALLQNVRAAILGYRGSGSSKAATLQSEIAKLEFELDLKIWDKQIVQQMVFFGGLVHPFKPMDYEDLKLRFIKGEQFLRFMELHGLRKEQYDLYRRSFQKKGFPISVSTDRENFNPIGILLAGGWLLPQTPLWLLPRAAVKHFLAKHLGENLKKSEGELSNGREVSRSIKNLHLYRLKWETTDSLLRVKVPKEVQDCMGRIFTHIGYDPKRSGRGGARNLKR